MNPARLARIAAACGLAAAAAVGLSGPARAGSEASPASASDLVGLGLERLLDMQVESASRFPQPLLEAPALVSVVTAADIKAYGWRTLADVLNSMRGVHLSYDRVYRYLGVRGFARSGDYNGRILLLLDGSRINENVYGQAGLGSEQLIDMELIDRVEFTTGPGSSVYGANAFFGVLNVITRRAVDLKGARVTAAVDSQGLRRLGASYGHVAEDGSSILLSVSGLDSRGVDRYFPEFDTPPTSDGWARGLDYDRSRRLYAKGEWQGFTFIGAHESRTKGVPTASYGQVFNDPRSSATDDLSYLMASRRFDPAPGVQLFGRVDYGRSGYEGEFVYDVDGPVVNRDRARGAWWGTDLKIVSTRLAANKLVAGIDYRRHLRRDQQNYYDGAAEPLLDDRRSGAAFGVYVQDEITLRPDLLLSIGLRYDRDPQGNGSTNPRGALVYKVSPSSSLKASFGSAYRDPNAYELFYHYEGEGGFKQNPDLRAETVRTAELAFEKYLGEDQRFGVVLFRNQVRSLIDQELDPADGLLVFRNRTGALARGVEFEWEMRRTNGRRARVNYSWQQATDASTGQTLVNSPGQLLKAMGTMPLGHGFAVGGELIAVGRRLTQVGEVPGYAVANLTLNGPRMRGGVSLSLSAYNLFGKRYADPVGAEHVQDRIEQDGRVVMLRVGFEQ